ncbi:presenilin family intramembrane aspartyl protease PSH [Salinigranum halophilum]|jgi:presenilin-like A22 family membrane protease|uniref:presenilin family intramembrane aspartyl protease PSH n=1 Tax=Salinigranum halophilum TaxID=2565931 RepID=UPI00115E0793|nr:presenilin family intramembrane aspartyl protease PSH [Salinigranum halophilum]
MKPRVYGGVAFAALLFLLVQLGALALVPTFYAEGYQQVEDPTDPTNSLLYIGAILVATALMLAAFKYDFDWAVRGVVVFTSGLLSWYVFSAVLSGLVPVVLAAAVAVALLAHPEWYVIDAAGVLMGAGAAALFGISFGVLPAVVLLSVLAVYDAISVYGTEHMLELAEGVMDLRIPVVLVIPTTLSYSLLDTDFSGANDVHEGDEAAEATADGGGVEADGRERGETEPTDRETEEESVRDAFFIGLGDAVMPTVMVASGAFFSPAASLGLSALPSLNLPALTAMVGTFLGFFVLMWAVMKGRAHAGLPLLNGGAVGGYLLGSLVAGVPLVEALGLARYL